jgi:uncharacterized membrane protein YkvA (DUF1232 family)
MSATDPFPKDRGNELMRRVPAYLRLALMLAKDPALSRARRLAIVGAAGYLVSPVDLVPGIIPVLGQLDDIAIAIAAVKFALAGLSPERRRAHLEAVGLGDDVLVEDLKTLGVLSAWVVRAGGRTTATVARTGGRVAARGSKAAVDRSKTAVRTGRAAAGAARDRVPPSAVPAMKGVASRVPSPRAAAAKAAERVRAASESRAADAGRAGVAKVRVIRVPRLALPARTGEQPEPPDHLEVELDQGDPRAGGNPAGA